MWLAITLGAVVALTIGLLLWCRGAMAASERRYREQVAANARINELQAAVRKKQAAADIAERKSRVAAAYARPAAPSTSRTNARQASSSRSSAYVPTYSPAIDTSYDFGGSSGSYSGGGSCSSDGGGGGGGCD